MTHPWNTTGNAGTNPATNFVGTSDGKPLSIQPGTGSVGIGTTTPSGKLEVHGNWGGNFGALTISGDKPTIRFSGGSIAGDQQWILHEGSDGPGNLQFFNGGTTGVFPSPVMSLKPSGNVEVVGNWNGSEGALTISGDKPTICFSGGPDAGNHQWILHEGSDGPGKLQFFYLASTGEWTQVMALTPDDPSVNAGGNVEVMGDILLANADCAEDFNVSGGELVEPGTVMVLDDQETLKPSEYAYDKRVAGVISGAGDCKPAIVLNRRPTQQIRWPLALVGKVFCKVDARFGSIEVGDLLTTSDTPGHAMKATDPVKAFGSVLGKALRPLRDGQGLVPLLVALQ
jgi:hypothetical protein